MWMANDLEAVTSPTAWQVNTGLFWQDFPVGCCSSQQFCYDTNDSGSPYPQLEPAHATQVWASWKDEKHLRSQSDICAEGFQSSKTLCQGKVSRTIVFFKGLLMTLHPVVLGEICPLRIWFSVSKKTWVAIWMVDKSDSGLLAWVCFFHEAPNICYRMKWPKRAHSLFPQI